MANNEEIRYLTEKRTTLTEKTKTNYVNYYKRLMTLTNNRQVKDMDEEELIDIIKNAVNLTEQKKLNDPLPISVKQSLLNVVIVIREIYDKPIDELKQLRGLNKEQLLEDNVVKNKALKEELPSVKELVDYTELLYKGKKWAKYIVNYLLINYNVRNMDLDLLITRNAKAVNDKDNWLVVREKSVRYLRYKFKTADKYVCRDNDIKSDKLMYAVNQLLGENETTPLLTTASGERISEDFINKYVARATYKELGQAKYFKILLNKTKANTEQMSVNRGTDYKTTLEYYDLEFKNAEGEQKKKAKSMKCNKKTETAIGEKKKTKAEQKALDILQAKTTASDSE